MKTLFRSGILSMGLALALGAQAAREQVKISDFVRGLDESGKLDAVVQLAESELERMIPDPQLRAELVKRLRTAREQKQWQHLDHFPVIPLALVKTLRPALGGMGREHERVLREKVTGKLEDYLTGDCTETSPAPKAVSPKLPGITDGHFADTSLGRCVTHQSFRLAKLLNSLERGEGTHGTFMNFEVENAEELFDALIKTRHTIEMRNERTYANFLSLNAGERPIIWPVWVDTGLKTRSGEPVVIPVGHSHHAWHISGPFVNARITFYLGVSGVGFFAQVDERPAWTGLRSLYSVSSKTPEGHLLNLEAVRTAGVYLRRIEREAPLYARGMPADGYGYLGVCNDSNAVMENTTSGKISSYPLMRAAELDTKTPLYDGLDEVIRNLPKDTEVQLSDRRSSLRRIADMFPFASLDDKNLHDDALRDTMREVLEEAQR
ncbi:MAG TPA: hypothetical protein VM901_11455 [Bdellovibrionota bacterium]|nr:hypothetical protein [Bdellovibrionota bacterium]